MGKKQGQSAAKTYKCMSLIGNQYGVIKVIGFAYKNVKSKTFMVVKCLRCGHDSLMRSDHILNPKAILSCCSKCRKDYVAKVMADRAFSPEQRDLHIRYQSYKGNAKTRNLRFDLTLAEFNSITKEDCHYCGDSNVGIDRIKNREGYVKGNIVPCCTTCNMMKKDLEYDMFLKHVSKVQRLSRKRVLLSRGKRKGSERIMI